MFLVERGGQVAGRSSAWPYLPDSERFSKARVLIYKTDLRSIQK